MSKKFDDRGLPMEWCTPRGVAVCLRDATHVSLTGNIDEPEDPEIWIPVSELDDLAHILGRVRAELERRK